MDRRAFLAGSLGLVAAPPDAGAQQPGKPARLGIIYGASPAFLPDTDPADRALVAGLRDQGYVLGQNVVVEFRSPQGGGVGPSGGGADPYPPLAADLIGLGVDVIVTTMEPAVKAAWEASRTIPIVMAGASRDPVAAGFVASLARPGGNVTGVTMGDIIGKRLELLREAVPAIQSVAAFHADLTFPINAQWLRATEAAAHRLGLALHPVRMPVETGQWEQAFETVSQRRIGAGTIHENPRWETNRRLLAELALKHRLPMVFTFRSQAQAGGLMSYAADQDEIFRRAGNLAARILKGAKPADLPVEQSTKFEFVINLKTARLLGVTLPESVRLRATDVIE
jgi:putative ABC transport system substrate-binding protein